MLKGAREVWYSLAAIVAVTALYALAYQQRGAMPAASSLVGHGIGVLGFLLMLSAETLYSWRKRSTGAHLGRTVSWLRFHIFAGLVGPYMVLLHTSLHFAGLAGVTTLLTGVVVASGAVGRYLYTHVPRSAEQPAAHAANADPGVSADALYLDAGAAFLARRRAVSTWWSLHVPLTLALFALAFVHVLAALYYATFGRW